MRLWNVSGMGAFDHLNGPLWGIWTAFGPGRGEFEKKQQVKCPGGCRGGMFKLWFNRYINRRIFIFLNLFPELQYKYFTSSLLRITQYDTTRVGDFKNSRTELGEPVGFQAFSDVNSKDSLPVDVLCGSFVTHSFLNAWNEPQRPAARRLQQGRRTNEDKKENLNFRFAMFSYGELKRKP